MGFRCVDLFMFFGEFTLFALIGNFRINPPKPVIWGCELVPSTLVKFDPSLPWKSRGFIIASPIVSKFCAETAASHTAPGLAIRAIRINFPNSESNSNFSSSVSGSPFRCDRGGKIEIS